MVTNTRSSQMNDRIGALQRIDGKHASGWVPLDVARAGNAADEFDDVVTISMELVGQS